MQELVTEDWRTLYGSECPTCVTQNGLLDDQEKNGGRHKIGLRERLLHFTWPWFISTMSTGGLGIVLAETPHRFRGKFSISRLAIDYFTPKWAISKQTALSPSSSVQSLRDSDREHR